MLLIAKVTLCSAVNYDTAWTFIYDGGKYSDDRPIGDDFRSIVVLKDGSSICIGSTADTSAQGGILFMKLSPEGKLVHEKLIYGKSGNLYTGRAAYLMENSDILLSGIRASGPWVLRTDSLGEIKWATWYYDSIKDKPKLSPGGVIQYN